MVVVVSELLCIYYYLARDPILSHVVFFGIEVVIHDPKMFVASMLPR
jgi:hypothetical protein